MGNRQPAAHRLHLRNSHTLLPEAARPDDANHPPGDATLIDTLRRIVTARQYAKIDGVLVDVWSASVTVLIWDKLREDKRQRLLTLPSHELILRCIAIYSHITRDQTTKDRSRHDRGTGV
ncbi:hypothetical protein ACGFLT_30620 [Micromonospora chalcea]|uniref:hypothetical protein n=1 Tax=Micromonospora TaxID=1873 RepID=UPI000E33239A|nr:MULTISPECIES: hypothetical protein [Micromonospora]AXO37796.1 hypothetical protein MicB006_5538 [Micromonospora sp. B006]